MKRYTVAVPLCATAIVVVEAENEMDAINMAFDEVANDGTLGYDPESSLSCWIDEVEDME